MLETAKIKEIYCENFRNFKNVKIPIGENITVISGHNGCGKSTLLALLSSTAGFSSYQPDFTEFFKIGSNEDFRIYKVFIEYFLNEKYLIKKRISLSDYSQSNRGIRIIPRTVKQDNESNIYNEFNIGESARIPIPSFYLSVSRIFPYGETNFKQINKLDGRSRFIKRNLHNKFIELYNSVLEGTLRENQSSMIQITKDISKQRFFAMDI